MSPSRTKLAAVAPRTEPWPSWPPRPAPAPRSPPQSMSSSAVTLLLERVRRGDTSAEGELMTVVYEELRRMAAARIAGQGRGGLLQPTELVNEAYLKLAAPNEPWEGRAHFFGAAAHVPRKERRARADELVETFSLHYGKKRVKTFSAGMRRRLGIASVLMGRPDLLLLDEPVTGLDPEGLELFAEVMCAEKARGATILFSSHRMRHVEEICDGVVVLRRGTPVIQTTLQELRAAVGARALDVDGLDDAALERVVASIESEGGTVEAERIPDTALRRYLLDEDGTAS